MYRLGARNIAGGDYEIIIRHVDRAEGTQRDTHPDGVTYINLMGLDRATITSSGHISDAPDGIVDPEYIDFDAGLLYFRNYQPFAPRSDLGYHYELDETVPEIYTQSEDYLRLHPEVSRFEIEARYPAREGTMCGP